MVAITSIFAIKMNPVNLWAKLNYIVQASGTLINRRNTAVKIQHLVCKSLINLNDVHGHCDWHATMVRSTNGLVKCSIDVDSLILYTSCLYYSLKSCSALEELILYGNKSLSRLPDVFGAMSSLRILHVSHCSLVALPERYVNSNNITSSSLQTCRYGSLLG